MIRKRNTAGYRRNPKEKETDGVNTEYIRKYLRRLSEKYKKIHIKKSIKKLSDARRLWSDQRITAILLAALGFANTGMCSFYTPLPGKTEYIRTPKVHRSAELTDLFTPSDAAETSTDSGEWSPSLTELNIARFFPDAADNSDPSKSYGGLIYNELMNWDSDWGGAVYGYSNLTPEEMAEKMGLTQQYVRGTYNPNDRTQKEDDPFTWTIGSFRNVWFLTEDGDGNTIDPYSNVREIMALANVYTNYHDPGDWEAFLSYCRKLWKASHFYTLALSDVYHCNGCVRVTKTAETETEDGTDPAAMNAEDEVTEGEATEAEAAVATASDAEIAETGEASIYPENDPDIIPESRAEAVETTLICPGHVDLTIIMRIAGLTEENNLFKLDPTGNDESGYTEDGWQGWNEENVRAAAALAEEDWTQKYGFRVDTGVLRITENSIAAETYLKELPSGLSSERQSMIRFALNSVGKVPYYWGGKPSSTGYSGNNFGTTITPDPEGRTEKGLDCSGWIAWVYWSATGKKLSAWSTTELAKCGKRISREELEPGDILVRTGPNAHTVMFLGWTEDGRIRCVHETSGGVDNVTISTRDADWPYYIRLVD